MTYTVVRRFASSRPRHATGVTALRRSLKGALRAHHRPRRQALRNLCLALDVPQELTIMGSDGSNAWWYWTR